jgi:hypothetical protein
LRTLLTRWLYEEDARPERTDCGTARLAATTEFRTARLNPLSNGSSLSPVFATMNAIMPDSGWMF